MDSPNPALPKTLLRNAGEAIVLGAASTLGMVAVMAALSPTFRRQFKEKAVTIIKALVTDASGT